MSWSYSQEESEKIKNAIEWTEDRLKILQQEADKPIYKENINLLRHCACEWNCIYDTINLKLQELRGKKIGGNYSLWLKSQRT